MRKKLSFSDCVYNYKDFRPNLLFYRFLAPLPDLNTFPKHHRLQMWIPNTIVYDGHSSPFWVFSKDGYVYRTDNFSHAQVISRLGSSNRHELVALTKTLNYEYNSLGHDVELLNNAGLKEKLRTIGCNKEKIAIQKFVKCKGRKAFMCRTVWTREKPPYCFLITNNYSYDDQSVSPEKRYVINIGDACSCSILHTLTGRHCEETGKYLKNLVQFVQKYTGIQFLQVAADFTKDESGDWYFLSLKAFKIRSTVPLNLGMFLEKEFAKSKTLIMQSRLQTVKGVRRREQYEKLAMCKLCQILFPPEELPHKLSMKMLIQAEKQLKHQGVNLGWLRLGEYENYDTAALYQPHKICESCFELFKALEDLRKQELELAWRLGIVEDRNDLIMIPEDGCEEGQATKRPVSKHTGRKSGISFYHQNSEEQNEWELYYKKPTALNHSVDPSNLLQLNTFTRYRFLVVLEELAEMSADFYSTQKITLNYSFIGFEQKIVLNSGYALKYGPTIPIQRVRLYYFFTDSVSGVNQLLRQKDKARIDLYFDNDKTPSASTMLDLSDFCSPLVTHKRYYFNCTGSKAMCYIKLAIGFMRCNKDLDASKIEIRQAKDDYPIYVPTKTYYACEPLPVEWIELIPNIRQNVGRLGYIPESARKEGF